MPDSRAALLLARQLRELGLSWDRPPDAKAWRAFLERVERRYEAVERQPARPESLQRAASQETAARSGDARRVCGERLQAILDALPDLLLLVDEDGRCLEVLSAQPERLPVPADRLVGRLLQEVLPERQGERILEALRNALAGDATVQVRYSMSFPAGERLFEGRCVPTQYRDRGRRCALFLVRDITEEVDSGPRERLIGAVFRAATEGIVILDAQRRVVSVNPAFERITELTPREVVGRPADFLRDVGDENRSAELWREVQSRGSWTGELTARRASGELYPLWVTVDTVPDFEEESVHYLVLMSDVTAVKQSRAELEYLATHDILTGMPNRRLFIDRLEGAMARARRTKCACALLFLDLDRFKAVNDMLGHQTGDALLQALALRLEGAIRASDSLARIGGDEFTVICEDLTSGTDVAAVAEKILRALDRPFRIRGTDIEVSASVGIAVFPDDAEDPDELLRHADAAMYAAKRAGRACFRFFTRELRDRADRLFLVEQRLRRALADGALRLVYQPQFELATRRLVGLEALLRLDDEEPGVDPDECIAVAEATGLIGAVGRAVLEQVLGQIRRWRSAGLPPVRVAVNVSRHQLVQQRFGPWVREQLEQAGVPGECLELEITEGAFVENEEAMQDNLRFLRRLGIQFAIDDFGTGHSSLVNLKRLPLDRLKIDRTFVRDVALDPNDEAIIRATVAMAHGLGLKVVAEGVETRQQLEFLRATGCDELQGFVWAGPEDPERVVRWLGPGAARPAETPPDA